VIYTFISEKSSFSHTAIVEILITRTEEEFATAFEKLARAKVLGCDTETGGLDSKRAELFSVQFSDGEFNVLVPTSEGIKLGKLAEILENPSIIKIFHNSRFDLSFLGANGYRTENVYDTMIAEKVLTKGANQSVSLAETLYRYYAVDLDKAQRKKFGRNWDKVWTKELVEYAMNDVFYLPRLRSEQLEWLKRLGLEADFEILLEKTVSTVK